MFLFIFDLSSTLERKNPLGLIAAFRQAFVARRTQHYPQSHPRCTPPRGTFIGSKEQAKSAGAIVIDQRLPKEELNGLIAACNCYVSLHRSEGLGLTIAEAMMLGKPTIATAYSGNLDFMDEDNSLLVGYDLVEIESDAGPLRERSSLGRAIDPGSRKRNALGFRSSRGGTLAGLSVPACQQSAVFRPRNAAAECSTVSIRFAASEAEGEGEPMGRSGLECRVRMRCGLVRSFASILAERSMTLPRSIPMTHSTNPKEGLRHSLRKANRRRN